MSSRPTPTALAGALRSDHVTTFKHRADMSDSKVITLFRVNSRGSGLFSSLVFRATRWFQVSFRSGYIHYLMVDIDGDGDGGKGISSLASELRYMGRVTPEVLCLILERKGFAYSAQEHALPLKEWCFDKGLLVEKRLTGIKLTLQRR